MDIEILEDERRVLLDGTEVRLGARAFDVLAFLAAHGDRVVTKGELLDAVWAGLLVEEGNLSVQIAGLRKALGRHVIHTVPGVGYRYTPVAIATPAAGTPEVPAIPSVAVLPFANLTGTTEQDFLVDGIVTEVIAALGRVSGIFVISSTSSFTYKGRAVDLADIGRDLGVRYVLEGSVQQAGPRIRVFVQLVEAETGHQIWQDRIEGATEDIFDLQDSIAERVAGALEPKLIWAEAARARARPTESLRAYDLCLRATPLVLRQDSLSNLETGLDLLDQARQLDPDYAMAKALVVSAHTGAFATRWWSHEKALAALPLAQDILQAGTVDGMALAVAGHYVAYLGGDPAYGLTALERAAEINPNSATTLLYKGWVHNYLDQGSAAIPCFERIFRISPLHPQIGIASCGIGAALLQDGKLDEAVTWLERSMAEYREFVSTHQMLVGVYTALGRMDEARDASAIFARKVPGMSLEMFHRTTPHQSPVYRDIVSAGLKATGIPD